MLGHLDPLPPLACILGLIYSNKSTHPPLLCLLSFWASPPSLVRTSFMDGMLRPFSLSVSFGAAAAAAAFERVLLVG